MHIFGNKPQYIFKKKIGFRLKILNGSTVRQNAPVELKTRGIERAEDKEKFYDCKRV